MKTGTEFNENIKKTYLPLKSKLDPEQDVCVSFSSQNNFHFPPVCVQLHALMENWKWAINSICILLHHFHPHHHTHHQGLHLQYASTCRFYRHCVASFVCKSKKKHMDCILLITDVAIWTFYFLILLPAAAERRRSCLRAVTSSGKKVDRGSKLSGLPQKLFPPAS